LGGFIYVEKIDVESKIGIVVDKNGMLSTKMASFDTNMKALFVEINDI